MADIGGENASLAENQAGGAASTGVVDRQSHPPSDLKDLRLSSNQENADAEDPQQDEAKEYAKDREERLRHVRDRQTEERQKRLEELKAQALAAQRFREQKEEERRRRIEELRVRDTDRRQQVEERKKAIWEAERDRRESILRKNQEREARIESKRKNDRTQIVFAFGSSTPRMLEPADTGGSFWGHRRATSTTNVTFAAAPLTRRASERELDGSKKRATSASGLDRQPGEDDQADGAAASAAYSRVARRRTDLMPTIPSPRDNHGGSRTSLNNTTRSLARSPGMRSGEVTPSNSSRPGSALSHQSTISVTRRPVSAPRKPRPASIAVTGVTEEANRLAQKHSISLENKIKTNTDKEGAKPPLPKQHTLPKKPFVKPETPKRSVDKIMKSNNVKASPRATPKVTPLQSPTTDHADVFITSQVEHSSSLTVLEKLDENQTSDEPQAVPASLETSVNGVSQKVNNDEQMLVDTTVTTETEHSILCDINEVAEKVNDDEIQSKQEKIVEQPKQIEVLTKAEEKAPIKIEEKAPVKAEEKPKESLLDVQEPVDMTASMIAKIRITTEEEAKAALAERRRLAREEAERQAELERKRQLEEEELELKRQREEEERQRRLEEETLRLVEEQRKAEEDRLIQAIEETKKREEEEKKRRDEEARQKIEKEEQDKKARDEAEKQREEMARRLEQEEREREARRKRVEAIMLRTRGKSGGVGNNTAKENEDKSPTDESSKTIVDVEQYDNNSKTNLESNQEKFEKSVTEKENALFKSTAPSPLIIEGLNTAISKTEPMTEEKSNSCDVVNKNNIQLNGDKTLENELHNNGHRNGADVISDNTEQNNTTNTLLNLNDCDTTSTNIKNTAAQNVINVTSNVGDPSHGFEQLINLNTTGVTTELIHIEDSVNSNCAFVENSDNNGDLSLL